MSNPIRRYNELVKADLRRKMCSPYQQIVAQISAELGIHVVILYSLSLTLPLQREVVPAFEKDSESWGFPVKFTVYLETAWLNATEQSSFCRERGLYPEQVERWLLPSQDANEKQVLTLQTHFSDLYEP